MSGHAAVSRTRCCYTIAYMNYPKQIQTGGAGEVGRFWKACCTALVISD